VPTRELRASGLEYLRLVTELLQRARLVDPEAGLWEAADLQWWWRMPRRSDSSDQLFWLDDDGPVAAAVLTDWRGAWGCDPMIVPGIATPAVASVCAGAVAMIEALGLDAVDVLVRDDDDELVGLLAALGFVAGDDRSAIAWMDVDERAAVAPVPQGFVLVDRARDRAGPHPMRRRNGDAVEERLRQTPLYDPALDLAVETADGEIAGMSLFWFDPVTEVGLVEPMRVEDAFQRRGLARALLTEGLDRLAGRGARRLKVGYGTEIARALYVGAGFRPTSTSTSYRWTRT
jgi:ribosomal protein S18 acetylase RimI-like enzyme